MQDVIRYCRLYVLRGIAQAAAEDGEWSWREQQPGESCQVNQREDATRPNNKTCVAVECLVHC